MMFYRDEDDEFIDDFESEYDYSFSSPINGFGTVNKNRELNDDDLIKSAEELLNESFEAKNELEKDAKARRFRTFKSTYGYKEYDPYDYYLKTGNWVGYSRIYQPALSVRYIRQMVAAFSNQFDVRAVQSDKWAIDIEGKTLYYEPYSLIYNTKGGLISTILHEVGHLAHTTPQSKMVLNEKYFPEVNIKDVAEELDRMRKSNETQERIDSEASLSIAKMKIKQASSTVVNVYEDFRIDTIMSHSYPSSEEIFKENIPSVKAVARNHLLGSIVDRYRKLYILSEVGKRFGLVIPRPAPSSMSKFARNFSAPMSKIVESQDARISLAEFLEHYARMSLELSNNPGLRSHSPSLFEKPSLFKNETAAFEFFGVTSEEGAQEAFSKMVYEALKETLDDFIVYTLLIGYGLEVKIVTDEMRLIIEKTKPAIQKCKDATSTQEVHDILCSDVFPIIFHLIESQQSMMQSGQVGSHIESGQNGNTSNAVSLSNAIEGSMNNSLDTNSQDPTRSGILFGNKPNQPQSQIGTRQTQAGGSNRDENATDVNPDWFKGDYKTLKSSVKDLITETSRRLVLAKREDESKKWMGHQTRGRVNTRSLYKFPAGSNRLFKQQDTNRRPRISQAFSILIDTSGSMYDRNSRRIVHSIRGVVTLVEALKSYGIPVELISFDNNANFVKKFEEDTSREIESRIAGLIHKNGGCTNLQHGFELTELGKRPEKIKTLIIFTDGGVGDLDFYDKYVQRFSKAGINTIGIAIEEDSNMGQIVDEWKELKDVQELPDYIVDVIRRIKR